MADLISRAAAIELIENRQRKLCPVGMFSRNAVYGSDREKFDCWQEIIDEIERLPTVDAVPVVRCAGCKHCFDTDRGTPYDGDDEWYCKRWERYVSAYAVDPYRFYCAAGEKREVRVKDQVCGGDGYGAE